MSQKSQTNGEPAGKKMIVVEKNVSGVKVLHILILEEDKFQLEYV